MRNGPRRLRGRSQRLIGYCGVPGLMTGPPGSPARTPGLRPKRRCRVAPKPELSTNKNTDDAGRRQISVARNVDGEGRRPGSSQSEKAAPKDGAEASWDIASRREGHPATPCTSKRDRGEGGLGRRSPRHLARPVKVRGVLQRLDLDTIQGRYGEAPSLGVRKAQQA